MFVFWKLMVVTWLVAGPLNMSWWLSEIPRRDVMFAKNDPCETVIDFLFFNNLKP